MANRDEAIDYETLKRLLLTPVVRTLRIAEMYNQDKSAGEIAGRMGMTEGAVRRVIERVRRKLKNTRHASVPV